MSIPYLDFLRERVALFDGAMGTQIQALELSPADFGGERYNGCTDHLVLTQPDAIRNIHRTYLAAGADVVETDTFGSTRLKLDEYDLGDQVREHNLAAARLAREACDEFATPTRPRFVAGSMGPSGFLPSSTDPELGRLTYAELKAVYHEQALALIDGGVDLLLVETGQDLLELRAAAAGCLQARREKDASDRVAVIVQPTLDTNGRMLLGTDIGAALTTLEHLGIDGIGLNCSTGPAEMRDSLRLLGQESSLAVSCLPNAGLPENRDGQAIYPMTPVPFAEALHQYAHDFSLSAVGGCCGTTPDHISELRKLLDNNPPVPHSQNPRGEYVASAMSRTALDQEPKPLLVGERINAQGSRKAKRLLLARDYAAVAELGRSQVEGGAHVLDLCVALTEDADEAERLAACAKVLSQSVAAPLMLDTTEVAALKPALENVPGRPIINSINLEDGGDRLRQVAALAVEHGADLVALTIDRDMGGMAKTADMKLAIAEKMLTILADEYGIDANRVIIDALTFTLATGQDEFRRSALETLEGIRRIKQAIPGVRTILGVSNVSFGLAPPARKVLNAVFLHRAVEAGLDLAIVNAAEVIPYAEIDPAMRELAEALIDNRGDDPLQAFVAATVDLKKNAEADDADLLQTSVPGGLDPGVAIHRAIVERHKDGIEDLIDLAVREHEGDAVAVLNTILLPAMKEVGDKFGAGELILPFVLQSAEVMKRAVAHLEGYLESVGAEASKGTVVIATVYGDVHDIGKNLVRTILSNNGYVVHDLGKQVPVQKIVDAAIEKGADAVGLSALLVNTSRQMPLVVRALHEAGKKVPVLIGGAAINRRFGYRTTFLDAAQSEQYAPGVFYCRDAFEGLAVMDRVRRSPDDAKRAADEMNAKARTARDSAAAREEGAGPVQTFSMAARLRPEPIPVPPAPHGDPVTLGPADIPLDEIFPLLDLISLYKMNWGVKSKDRNEYERLITETFEPRRFALQEEAKANGWLTPKAAYQFFEAARENDTLHLRRLGHETIAASFTWPRQSTGAELCLADYCRDVETARAEGQWDVVALMVVTVGDVAMDLCTRWSQEGAYEKALLLHGLAVQSAEATAEWTHRRLRRDWGIEPGRGKRYAPGYPACPDVADHVAMFRLLPVTEAIGVSLTDAHQLVPEATTAAIVMHHPKAIYYHIR